MVNAQCTGCRRIFPIGPQAEADIAEGRKGYCAIVQEWVILKKSHPSLGTWLELELST